MRGFRTGSRFPRVPIVSRLVVTYWRSVQKTLDCRAYGQFLQDLDCVASALESTRSRVLGQTSHTQLLIFSIVTGWPERVREPHRVGLCAPNGSRVAFGQLGAKRQPGW